MMYVQILAGFIFLLGGAELMVRGAVAVAQRLGVRPMIIGMTIVAIGTSSPEIVVSLNAALAGASGIALGNLVGSNIANVLLILGVAILLRPIHTDPKVHAHDAVVMLGGSLLFAWFCYLGVIGRLEGLLLLAAFFAFLANSYRRALRERRASTIFIQEVEEYRGLGRSLKLAWLALIGGLGGILFGADTLVQGGVQIARATGVSDEVIGLTVIAFGTSLPELAASGVAAYRGHAGVALGNVVGSNLFNVLGVAGLVATVTPLEVADQIRVFDLWVMLASSAALIFFMVTGWRLSRREGSLMVAAYGVYILIQAYGVPKLMAVVAGTGP